MPRHGPHHHRVRDLFHCFVHRHDRGHDLHEMSCNYFPVHHETEKFQSSYCVPMALQQHEKLLKEKPRNSLFFVLSVAA